MSNGTPLTKGSLHTSDEEKVRCTRYFDSNTILKVTLLLFCLTDLHALVACYVF